MKRDNTWSYSANRYKEIMECPLRGFSKCFNQKKVKEYLTMPEGKTVNVDRIINKREDAIYKKTAREMNDLLRQGAFMQLMKVADECIFPQRIYSRLGKEKNWEEFDETTEFLKQMEQHLTNVLNNLRKKQKNKKSK